MTPAGGLQAAATDSGLVDQEPAPTERAAAAAAVAEAAPPAADLALGADGSRAGAASSAATAAVEEDEEEEGDGIVAAWVIGNQRALDGPQIVHVNTIGHGQRVVDEAPRGGYGHHVSDREYEHSGDDEHLLRGGTGGSFASRLRTSLPPKVSDLSGRAMVVASSAAGMARTGLSAAASSSERAMGAAGSAAGAVRQSAAQAAPAKVTELGTKAREKASMAKEKLSGAADVNKAKEKAQLGLAQAAQSFARFTRKG